MRPDATLAKKLRYFLKIPAGARGPRRASLLREKNMPLFFFRRERGVVFSFPIFSFTKMEKRNLETIDFSKKKLAYEVDIRFPNFRNDYGTYFNAN